MQMRFFRDVDCVYTLRPSHIIMTYLLLLHLIIGAIKWQNILVERPFRSLIVLLQNCIIRSQESVIWQLPMLVSQVG